MSRSFICARLGDLVAIRTGKLDANASSIDGDYPFFTCSREPLRISSFSYECECVLVAGNGDLNVKYYEGKFDAYQRTYILESEDKSVLDTRYLFHWMSLYVERLRTMSVGGVIKYIKLGHLADAQIPLPPFEQQQRISAILDKADQLRAKRRSALVQLNGIRESLFFDLFGDLATNPRRWPEKTIAELCEVKGGKRLPKGEQYSQNKTPYRYIRVTDLKDGAVDQNALVYLKPEVQAKISRYVVNSGDIIISIAGSIGLIAPVPGSLDGANLTENAAKLVPRDRNAYDAAFLATLLQMPFVQNQIGSHIGQVTIGKLALFRIEKIRLPLPPLNLQREFVRRLNSVDEVKKAQRASLAQMGTLFASLQHRAFRGEL